MTPAGKDATIRTAAENRRKKILNAATSGRKGKNIMKNTRKNIITRNYHLRIVHKELSRTGKSKKTAEDAIIPVTVTGESVADCVNAARAEGLRVADKYGAGRSCQVLVDTETDQSVMLAALQIALRSIKNAIAREDGNGGTPTQRVILRDLQAVHCAVYAAADPAPAYISDRIAQHCGADAGNYIAGAWDGIITARAEGKDVAAQYRAGYRAINVDIMRARAASAWECSTEFITDSKGHIIPVSDFFAVMCNADAKYNPVPSPRLAPDIQRRLRSALCDILALCTALERRTVYKAAEGYSYADIARLDGVTRAAVSQRMSSVRVTALKYLLQYAPDLRALFIVG